MNPAKSPLRRPHPAPRGQTLMLWALTLLVLTLMVCITLSVGSRVREKIETQNLADTAAYSNAVATARSFNIISLMNRTQISHMVAQAGAQSLINWTSEYMSALSAAHTDLSINFAELTCNGPFDIQCPCKLYTQAMLIIQSIGMWIEEDMKFPMMFFNEQFASNQARGRWLAGMFLYGLEVAAHQFDLMNNNLNNQQLASKVLNGAFAGTTTPGELSAPTWGDQIAKAETGDSIFCATGSGAVCNPNSLSEHAVEAAMGSRGYMFVTARWDSDILLTAAVNNVLSTFITPGVTSDALVFRDPTFIFGMGSAYFNLLELPTHGFPPPIGMFSSADDHTFVEVNTTGPFCSATSLWPAQSWLNSGNALTFAPGFLGGAADHVYMILPQVATLFEPMAIWPTGVVLPPLPWTPLPIIPSIPMMELDAQFIHPVSALPQLGIWPLFIDYNFTDVQDDKNNFGQPKNYAVIQRDYSARPTPDPFNLFFNFRFANSGPTTSQFDNRGIQLTTPGFAGIDISKMTAMSTGIAYYHRAGHWKEPPNFLSPFWRATLVAADTDTSGQTDPGNLLNGNAPQAAQLWNALRARGFQGIQ